MDGDDYVAEENLSSISASSDQWWNQRKEMEDKADVDKRTVDVATGGSSWGYDAGMDDWADIHMAWDVECAVGAPPVRK